MRLVAIPRARKAMKRAVKNVDHGGAGLIKWVGVCTVGECRGVK